MVASETVVPITFEVPLPHRSLSRAGTRWYRAQSRAAQWFLDDVQRALLAALAERPATHSGPLVLDVTLGTRDGRRVGAFWLPSSRAQMLEIAQLVRVAVAATQLLGSSSASMRLGEVRTTNRWGPRIRVQLSPDIGSSDGAPGLVTAITPLASAG